MLISARLSPNGPPARLVTLWAEGAFELVVSPLLLDELSGVLSRRKFRHYVTEQEVTDYVNWVRSGALSVEDPPAEHGHTPDPDDDYLVTLARSCGADLLVSGDSDSTGLRSARPPIVTPAELVRHLDPP